MEGEGEQPRRHGKWHDCKKLMCIICAVMGYAMPFVGFIGGAYLGTWLTKGYESNALQIFAGVVCGGALGGALGPIGFVWYFLFMQMEHRLCAEEDDYYG
jgi:hypothetical protein